MAHERRKTIPGLYHCFVLTLWVKISCQRRFQTNSILAHNMSYYDRVSQGVSALLSHLMIRILSDLHRCYLTANYFVQPTYCNTKSTIFKISSFNQLLEQLVEVCGYNFVERQKNSEGGRSGRVTADQHMLILIICVI